MKCEYVGIGTNNCFSVDIDCNNDDIESLSIDGVPYDLDFLIEIAPDFIEWCYDQIENSPVAENPYFEED